MPEKLKKSQYQHIIEKKLHNLLDDSLIEKFEVDEYYDWLTNPRTKKNLQIDIFITFKDKVLIPNKSGNRELKNVQLAIEVQGEQHYEYIKEFHKRPYGFKSSQFRDQFKVNICKRLNIPLIRIKYDKINWQCDVRGIILNELKRINRHKKCGKPNINCLIEIFENSKYSVNKPPKISPEMIYRLNEFTNFLKNI